MFIRFSSDRDTLNSCIRDFIQLVGADDWNRRIEQLDHDWSGSSPQAKIVLDYHWLEYTVAHYLINYESGQYTHREPLTNVLWAALLFVQTVVGIEKQLSLRARKTLLGRLKDALKAESGFAAIYIELSVARRLFASGFEVEFADMEGAGQFDLKFWKDDIQGEVECKSLSCDAGRKIHRKTFYRFVDTLMDVFSSRAQSGASEIFVVTLHDRMPTSLERQSALRNATRRLSLNPEIEKIDGNFFTVSLQRPTLKLISSLNSGHGSLYKDCVEQFGANCHISGVHCEEGTSLVVARSEREDDTSAPLLKAMKKASSQFSGMRPAFIAIQYDDIEPADLLSRAIRRRAGILSLAAFHGPNSAHLAATYFCAYRGIVATEAGVGEPAFSVANPLNTHLAAADYKPFLENIADEEFAQLLGKPCPEGGISYIPIDDSDESERQRVGR